jgi:hypothetical protein
VGLISVPALRPFRKKFSHRDRKDHKDSMVLNFKPGLSGPLAKRSEANGVKFGMFLSRRSDKGFYEIARAP